jgi:hypothetical protein
LGKLQKMVAPVDMGGEAAAPPKATKKEAIFEDGDFDRPPPMKKLMTPKAAAPPAPKPKADDDDDEPLVNIVVRSLSSCPASGRALLRSVRAPSSDGCPLPIAQKEAPAAEVRPGRTPCDAHNAWPRS